MRPPRAPSQELSRARRRVRWSCRRAPRSEPLMGWAGRPDPPRPAARRRARVRTGRGRCSGRRGARRAAAGVAARPWSRRAPVRGPPARRVAGHRAPPAAGSTRRPRPAAGSRSGWRRAPGPAAAGARPTGGCGRAGRGSAPTGPLRQRQEPAGVPVVEVLPGQVGQLGRVGQPQPHAQPGVPALGLVAAGGQGAEHLVVEDGVEEPAAEVADRGGLRLVVAADHVAARPADAQQEVVQLEVGERDRDRHRAGLTGEFSTRAR